MGTNVNIGLPPVVREAANASQAVNRKRLEDREIRIRVEKKAARLIKIEDQKIQNKPKKGKKDLWKGAIPEYENKLILPKRLTKAVFGWILQENIVNQEEDIESWYDPSLSGDYTLTRDLKFELNSSKIQSSSFRRGTQRLNTYIHRYDYFKSVLLQSSLISGQTSFSKNSKDQTYIGGSYTQASVNIAKTESLYSCLVVSSLTTKYRLVFDVKRSLEAKLSVISFNPFTPTHYSNQFYELHVGLFVPLQSLSKSSYFYLFRVENSAIQWNKPAYEDDDPLSIPLFDPSDMPIPKLQETLCSRGIVFDSGTNVPELKLLFWSNQYNESTPCPVTQLNGNVFVEKIELLPSYKKRLKDLLVQGQLNYTCKTNTFRTFNPSESWHGSPGPDLSSSMHLGHFGLTILSHAGTHQVNLDSRYEIVYSEKDYGPVSNTIFLV
jgi:hypothetical protein